ncbi:MAG TPA: hypothetical protein VKT30_07080 [Caulobacteraceae bacterium]|nr:hypothetical protein [Caulobacteraceae bacterium]
MRTGRAATMAAAAFALVAASALAQPLSEPAPPAVAPAAAQPLRAPDPPPSPEPTALWAGDACEAKSLAWLVGKPRSEIPVPVNPGLRRVYCSTCLVTQDYVPGRTDIVFDADSGVITAVKCG